MNTLYSLCQVKRIFLFLLETPSIWLDSGLSEYSVHVGDSLSVLATVTGVTAPTVTWSCKGDNVSCRENIKLDQKGNKHIMMITKLEVSDSDLYIITAENKHGQDKKKITVTVIGNKPYHFYVTKLIVS